jgi:hypothetical protein
MGTFMVAPLASADAASRTAADPLLRLPSSPGTVILRLTSTGGMDASPASRLPVLELQAGGDFAARPATPAGPPRRGRLSPKEVEQLLKFVVREQRYSEIDGRDITQRMKQIDQQLGRLSILRDAGDMKLEVTLPGYSHSVEMLPPGLTAREYPDIAELARFKAIVDRLLGIAASAS